MGARPAVTPDAALEHAIAEACLGEETGEVIARDLRGFLSSHGVAPEDIEAIMAAPQRLAVYRSLVRNGLTAVILKMLPRTRARMNAARPGRFDADMARFFSEVGPRTHYLRDVPREMLEWAEPIWKADPEVPGYLPDLAAHELACFAVAAAEGRDDAAGTEPTLEVTAERPMVFASAIRLMRYAWAVHELPVAEDATGEPPVRDVHLLAYRDAGHAVRWLELTPLAASIVGRLAAGESLGYAVEQACADHRTAPADVVTDVARLLAGLAERGVLLGAKEALR
jgi:hypothetical protein